MNFQPVNHVNNHIVIHVFSRTCPLANISFRVSDMGSKNKINYFMLFLIDICVQRVSMVWVVSIQAIFGCEEVIYNWLSWWIICIITIIELYSRNLNIIHRFFWGEPGLYHNLLLVGGINVFCFQIRLSEAAPYMSSQ